MADSTTDKSKKPIVITKAFNWPASNLSEQVKSFRFVSDGEGNIWTMSVMLIDPVSPGSDSVLAYPVVSLKDAGTGAGAQIANTYGNSDVSPTNFLFTAAGMLVNNRVDSQYEYVRTPTSYKSVETAAAAATADVWTPAAGKKFRVLGGVITMSGLIAAAAKRSLKLIEETAGTVIVQVGVTIPVLGCNVAIPFDLRPNGFLASTADKKLQVTTAGGTYTTGSDWVNVWGTEE